MKARRIITAILTVIILIGLLATPVHATTTPTGSYVSISIPAQNFGSDYTAYNSEREAEENPINLQVTPSDFPITAKIVGKNGGVKDYEFDSYGTKKLKVSDLNGTAHVLAFLLTFGISLPSVLLDRTTRYAVVKIEKPATKAPTPTTPSNTVSSTQVVTSVETANSSASTLSLEEKFDILMGQINFPFAYRDYSSYAKEVKAYLAGEWDGSQREGDDWGSYTATRYVSLRDYHWIATNHVTGEGYQIVTNVDYNGYKEIVPGATANQHYSLAVSRIDGEIEQWALFEKQDAWKIDQVASCAEQIQNVIPLANDSSQKDDCSVFVSTTDSAGQQHIYSLLPGGRVIRTV